LVTREDIGYRECMPCQVRIDAPEVLRQSILKKAFERKLLGEAELEACRREPDWEHAENFWKEKLPDKSFTIIWMPLFQWGTV